MINPNKFANQKMQEFGQTAFDIQQFEENNMQMRQGVNKIQSLDSPVPPPGSIPESPYGDITVNPKMLVLNFPSNPTGHCVELPFFERVVEIAKQHDLWVVHDLAYADLVFDGYEAPSILQVPGARDIAVEFFTLSKSYNMPGWRVGFCCGNRELVAALTRIKSYLDYGIFTPVQVAAIAALEGDQQCVHDICDMYRRRRDVLCQGLNEAGWPGGAPKATMFVWAQIPEAFRHMGSVEFSKLLLQRGGVAVVGVQTHHEGVGIVVRTALFGIAFGDPLQQGGIIDLQPHHGVDLGAALARVRRQGLL